MTSAADSLCPRCGRSFGCGVASEHCWCHDLRLKAGAIAELRERYDACLCPECLRLWAADETGSADETTATGSGVPPVVAVSGSEG